MSGIGLRAFGARRDTSNLPSASITLVSRVLQCNGWWYLRDACTRHQGILLVERRLVLLAVVRFFFFLGAPAKRTVEVCVAVTIGKVERNQLAVPMVQRIQHNCNPPPPEVANNFLFIRSSSDDIE